MKISILIGLAKEFAKTHEAFANYVESRFWSSRDDQESEMDITMLDDKELSDLRVLLTANLSENPGLNGAIQRIAAYQKIMADPTEYSATNLNELATALKIYIGATSNRRWLFKMLDDNMKLPYLVENIQYSLPVYSNGYTEPAKTTITMKYVSLDVVGSNNIVFTDQNLRIEGTKKLNRLSVAGVLQSAGYVTGLPILCEEYDKEIDIFLRCRDRVGEQFTSTGVGKDTSRSYSSMTVPMNTDGVYHKLVVDEPSVRKINGDQFSGGSFWDKDKDSTMRVPLHPFINVFNLKTHTEYTVHTSTLIDYQYHPELIHKLILNDEVKELIEVLGKGTKENHGDIIAGKADGIIIGCFGDPGLGKSLTAEIYSEFLGRPLYTVQCSQLGISPEQLENKLNKVLERASRWKAVLLLDEADVYIRPREDDLVQNAIVGVFLRVLEYYHGIIFFTSNLLNVDDAIESRLNAKIIYNYPNAKQLKEIWEIQLVNHGWELDNEMINKLLDKFTKLAGRDVRAIVNLASMLCRYKKEKISYEMIMHAGKFGVIERQRRYEDKS